MGRKTRKQLQKENPNGDLSKSEAKDEWQGLKSTKNKKSRKRQHGKRRGR